MFLKDIWNYYYDDPSANKLIKTLQDLTVLYLDKINFKLKKKFNFVNIKRCKILLLRQTLFKFLV